MNIVETHKKAIPLGMAFLCDFGGWLYSRRLTPADAGEG